MSQSYEYRLEIASAKIQELEKKNLILNSKLDKLTRINADLADLIER